jgi:uncharacterized SAM-binding protein YcdF (DUF218 family)
MTGALRRAADGLLLLLGVGLIATPWLFGFFGDMVAQWTAWTAGGAIAAAAIVSLGGESRSGAFWSMLAGVATVAAQFVPGVGAHPALVWSLTGAGAAAAVLGLIFYVRRGASEPALA